MHSRYIPHTASTTAIHTLSPIFFRKKIPAIGTKIKYNAVINPAFPGSLVYKIPLAIVPQYVIYNKEHMYIPEMTFPNLWYYYDLDIADWSVIEEDSLN